MISAPPRLWRHQRVRVTPELRALILADQRPQRKVALTHGVAQATVALIRRDAR